jgi:hypothetical protein
MTRSTFHLIATLSVISGAFLGLTSCVTEGYPSLPPGTPLYITNFTTDSLQIRSQWPDSLHRTDILEIGEYQTARAPTGAYHFGYPGRMSDLRVTLLFYGTPNLCYHYSGPITYEGRDIRLESSFLRNETKDSAIFLITQSIRDSAKPCE